MAIGIVKDNKEFEKEIRKVVIVDKDTDKIKESFDKDIPLVKPTSTGRGLGNVEVDDVVRKFVAEIGIEGYSNSEIKDITGLSQSSISAYKNGATSTASYNKTKAELQNHIIKVKGKIHNKARRVAIQALDVLLEPGRIAQSKTRDIATIARTASAIIKDMEAKEENHNSLTDNRVQFIMMAPVVKQEFQYDAIDVSSQEIN